MARSTRRLSWSIALLVTTAALVWLWSLVFDGGPRPARAPQNQAAQSPDDGAGRRTQAPPPASGTRTPQRPATGPSPSRAACAPRTRLECQVGDVYWIDACDQRGEKAQECGTRLCKGEACEPADDLACAGLPQEGVCDGDVVRGCLSGWLFERDCRALGKRCVIGDEGAVCRKPSEDDCDRQGPLPRCSGDKLFACVEGEAIVRDCVLFDARCAVLPQTGYASCVASRELERAPRDKDPCGPCGCPNGAAPEFTEEQCNGQDDDGDDWVDEDVSCEPLQVIAFVVSDATGQSSYSREDIEREIDAINAIFAAEHGGLRMQVSLAAVHDLPRSAYLRVDDSNFNALLDEVTSLASSAPGLQVPIVFTDEVIAEDAPKAGLSTIPNGTCGGERRSLSPQPPLGMVVLAKRRAPTTGAHELGHFLGLCHTHEVDPQAVVQTAHWRDAQGRDFSTTCDTTCSLEGDGMCDTPFDPGPEGCSYDLQCSPHCRGGAAPSTRNLMSYYTDCRDQLTPQQTMEVKRTRSVLEGFFRCAVQGPCPCTPGDSNAGCPEQMTCRPGERGAFSCMLDGAFLEGESCRAQVQCGAGLICAGGRCTRLPER